MFTQSSYLVFLKKQQKWPLLTAKHFQTQLTKKVREIKICTILTPSKIIAAVSPFSSPLGQRFFEDKYLNPKRCR
jgi:hypothetical protein